MRDEHAADRDGTARGERGLPAALLPFPLLRLSADGIVRESNGLLERELGLEAGALLGRSLDRHLDGDGAALAEAMRRGSTVRLRLRAMQETRELGFDAVPDDDSVWLIARRGDGPERDELRQAHLRAEAPADEFAHVSVQLRRANEELTARAAQLHEATAAKSLFLHTMSHELRTPLNAVLGYAGLLRDGVYGRVSERQRQAVDAIVRRARDLQLLIDDVLDLSRIEGGRLDLRSSEFSASRVLEEVREAIAADADEKGLTITVRHEIGRPVRLDRAKYVQIVTHLASNAVKFTPRRGEIELAVRDERPGSFVTVVRDTGIGIPSERMNAIFEDFEQLESGHTRRYPGIGLGLSIVKRLIDALGGRIDVESRPGRGSTFTITLPTEMPASPIEVDGGETLRAGEPVLLAIDDDPEVIALLRDSLTPDGYQIVGATSGDRGIELARMLRPFAITLDIQMPEKDGWQVLRELKADPELRDIPVVIMSIVAERALGFSLGVTEYLVKPVERPVLLDVLGPLRRRKGPDVLVVDDDRDTLRLLGDLLDSLGYLPRFARDAEEAIGQLEAKPPEVMIIDVTLPAAEVSRVFERVSGDPRLSGVRTVIITRSDRDGHPAELRERAAGAVAIEGNEQPHALLRVLREALSRSGPTASV